MLAGLDAIVIDLQDIGTRFYTYMTTMAYVMEEAAARKIKVVVLDRPNPIGGVQIEGPALDAIGGRLHGLLPADADPPQPDDGRAGAAVQRRDARSAPTSPSSRCGTGGATRGSTRPGCRGSTRRRTCARSTPPTLYPGIGAFEGANLSVGRGTDTPFEHVGAPWIDGVRLADALNARQIPGVRFYPVRFTPTASKFAGEECGGVFIVITDRAALRPVRVGVEMASALVKLFPGKFEIDLAARLFGSTAGLDRLKAGDDPAAVAPSWRRRRSALAPAAREVSDLTDAAKPGTAARRHRRKRRERGSCGTSINAYPGFP